MRVQKEGRKDGGGDRRSVVEDELRRNSVAKRKIME
jgi:hypothetical protein